ncbi:MAG: response regulator [Actinomycetota bacterium]|nr:response regulator [Actinomycetota bacterium]
MGERILLVDDEHRLLDGLRRSLRGRYVISTASSGHEGLELVNDSLAEGNAFAVVVSDMMMPGMSGAEFLTSVRPLSPDTVLMVLSGQADLTSTINAVNNANLFRFLTKPIESQEFTQALDAALRQHQLITSERELLANTLTGAVGVLTDVLSMASSIVSRRTERMRNIVVAVAEMLGVDDDWRLPVAAMLSHLGCIALPGHVMEQVDRDGELAAHELEMWQGHPLVGQQLLRRIPRLEEIADWIGSQPMNQTEAEAHGDPFPDFASAILPATAAFLVCFDSGAAARDVARTLNATGRFPGAVVEAVLTAVNHQLQRGVVSEVRVRNLLPGMIVEDDIITSNGLTLVRQGERVTEAMIARLLNFSRSVGVQEPFRVRSDT